MAFSSFEIGFLTSVGLMVLSIIGIMITALRLESGDSHETIA